MADRDGGDPAQAFEDLRAEVSVLRRAIEAAPGLRDRSAPDYSAEFGVLGKGLDDISDQLRKLLKAPALVRTLEEQGQAIANAGAAMVREAAQRLDGAVQRLDWAAKETDQERARLSGVIGQALTRGRQFKVLGWTAAIALAVGLVLSPIIASLLPPSLKIEVAARLLGPDRWNAGASLMEAANPARWQSVNADLQLVLDNRQVVEACRAAAARSGRAQRCAVTVAPRSPQP